MGMERKEAVMQNVKMVLGVAAALLLGVAARADTSKVGAARDHEFLEKAAQGGLAEVKLGRLAIERGQSPAVKEFGRRMVADHTRVDHELRTLATKKGVTLPTRLDSHDQQTLDRLSKLPANEFDKAYLDAMLSDHETDVAAFQEQATSGTDSDIKSFASKTLPTLQAHEDMARQDLNKLGVDQSKEQMKNEAQPPR
jgi:putative membrane protein